jgi:single-stranded-DNA-specific exonuclease
MTGFRNPREVIAFKAADPAVVVALARDLGVSAAIARILVCRDLPTFDACKCFFSPDRSHFNDPFRFSGMRAAVDRIVCAIRSGEKIFVHGDYDVDGVTATALLVKILRRMGAACDYYLPNRLTDGYGMSADAIDDIFQRRGSLIITVDCGITAFDAVARARERGIDVIITDHHEAHGLLPEAYAILNPKITGCGYPEVNLAGVGVALKLSQAIVAACGADAAVWYDHLDLVALGTAADIVPLTGENRIIVKIGFAMMSRTANRGLRTLITLQGLEGKEISTSDVVFLLAPCINAAGRLGDSLRGVKLLLTEDSAESELYARELVAMNQERRALDAYVQDSASAWILEHIDLTREPAIVAGAHDWHAGVIGIAASKMVDKFCRPAFLFSLGSDGMAKGSGRSAAGMHLLDALNDCKDLLVSYGGHEAAAGATVRIENLEPFRKRFNEAVGKRLSLDDLVPRVMIDTEIDIAHLTPKFFSVLKRMEPFGPGNMRPVLLCKGLSNRYEPRVVGNNHLKMVVAKNGQVIDAIAFNFGDRIDELKYSDSFSLAFSLDENTWNGRTTLQMKVKGVVV